MKPVGPVTNAIRKLGQTGAVGDSVFLPKLPRQLGPYIAQSKLGFGWYESKREGQGSRLFKLVEPGQAKPQRRLLRWTKREQVLEALRGVRIAGNRFIRGEIEYAAFEDVLSEAIDQVEKVAA